MGHLRNFVRAILPNPLDKKIKALSNTPKIVFFWNRGLGDIPLELYFFTARIKSLRPLASLTVITREDLKEGFLLLEDLRVLTSPHLQRKKEEPYPLIFQELGLKTEDYEAIFYKPDPAYWIKNLKKKLHPTLKWASTFYHLINLPTVKPLALLHIDSETVYNFEKNLPLDQWKEVITQLQAKGYFSVLLGAQKTADTLGSDIDLRGKTTLFEIITLMMEPGSIFIGPDSGLLNILYFLNIQHPLQLISYWSNVRVGLLQQNSPSPNPLLRHTPIIASDLKTLDPALILNQVNDYSPLYLKHRFNISPPLADKIHQALSTLKHLKIAEPLSYAFCEDPRSTELNLSQPPSPYLCPIILAGGHGTRLESDEPKALFKILGKSLIHHFCEKIKQASLKLNMDLKAFMMVSVDGHFLILDHLKKNKYFGLKPDQLTLLIQENLPLITPKNQLVLKTENTLHYGPGGNGEVFHLLEKIGFFNKPAKDLLGFEIIPIDNVLAPLFLEAHATSFINGYDSSLISILHNDPTLPLGKISHTNEGIRIIEYTHNAPHHLTHANTGLIGFSYPFAKKIGQNGELKVHTAHKNYPCFNGKASEKLTLKKYESFIFDHLSQANSIKIHHSKASLIFQPLKAKEGYYGIKACEKALIDAKSF